MGNLNLRWYVYLDSEGIDSLYAQTVERVEQELRTETRRRRGKHGVARLNLGGLFGHIGLPSVSGEAGLNSEDTDAREALLSLAVEQKVEIVVQAARQAGALAATLETAVELMSKRARTALPDARYQEGPLVESWGNEFFAVGFDSGVKDWVKMVNHTKALLFTTTLEASKGHLARVLMFAGFHGVRTGVKQGKGRPPRLSENTHLTALLSAGEGRIQMGLLGFIRPARKLTPAHLGEERGFRDLLDFQTHHAPGAVTIKPLALWA